MECGRSGRQEKIAIVDATPDPGEVLLEAGSYDLSALLARIEHAIHSVGASRVVLDAIGALFPQFTDANVVRRELHRLHSGLRKLDVTTLITMERTDEDGPIGRFGVEEFVADNVIVLAQPSRSGKTPPYGGDFEILWRNPSEGRIPVYHRYRRRRDDYPAVGHRAATKLIGYSGTIGG